MMMSCDTCVVRNRAICASLEKGELDRLNRIGRRVAVHRGQTLMWEGDDSSVVANVIDGVLKLSTSTADGREQIVGVVYPSDFIGRPFGSTTHHSVTALSDAQVCIFTRAAFDDFARDYAFGSSAPSTVYQGVNAYNGVNYGSFQTLPNNALVSSTYSKQADATLLFTYLPHPGTAFYAGYANTFQNVNFDAAGSPNFALTSLPGTSTDRQIFVKFNYLLRF